MAAPHRRVAALLAAALFGVMVPVGGAPGPARAQAVDVFVQVNPSTVEAGYLVGIRASCTRNTRPAKVESAAFGEVTAQPQGGFLSAAPMVPEHTRADTFRVRLTCPEGRSASTELIVVAAVRPRRGPATGFGGTAEADPGGYLVVGGLAAVGLGAALGLTTLTRRRRPAVPTGRSGR